MGSTVIPLISQATWLVLGAPADAPQTDSSSMLIIWIVLAIVAIIGLLLVVWGVGIYNALVSLRNRFKNAFAQIDVQLKRRYDLIPNLVEVAKGYLAHERQTLEAVIAARNTAAQMASRAAADPTDAGAMKQLLAAEGTLAGGLGRIFALAEAYPDLKANQTMMQLTEELTSTENKVSFARQAYNDAVMVYNTSREIFPNVIFAGIFNFQAAVLYEIENQAEKQAPKVSFTK
jgi:LemA protein